MTLKSIRVPFAALCIAALFGATTLACTNEAAAAEKVSKAVGATLNEALKSMQAKDWPAAVVKIDEQNLRTVTANGQALLAGG